MSQLNMFPQLVSNYHLDCPSGDSELFCQFQSVTTLFSQLSQISDLFNSKFRMWIIFAKENFIASTFIYHIFDVVRLSSLKQMLRIYTGRIITGMARLVSLADGATKFLFQDNPMDIKELSIYFANTIAHASFTTCPKNTIIHSYIISQRSQEYNRALSAGEIASSYQATKWRYGV